MAEPRASVQGSAEAVDLYDSTYGRFDEALGRQIRAATFDEDFGQNSWISAREHDQFMKWLALSPNHHLLDVACGSGGPVLRIAERTGAAVTGVDLHADAITAASRRAASMNLVSPPAFLRADARATLPFPDGSFDAITCIDAINHLPDRPRVLADWARVLRPGGRILFTDPVVITGPLTSEELAIRASIGFFLFVPMETNDLFLAQVGLQILHREDLTAAVDNIASRWHAARGQCSSALRQCEGDATFEGQQRFFELTARLARERRLSRFAYLARRP